MPGTKITLIQILVANPRHPHDPVEDRGSVLVPHAKGGSVQVVNAQFAGGGRNEWALDILILEPTTESDQKKMDQSQEERRKRSVNSEVEAA